MILMSREALVGEQRNIKGDGNRNNEERPSGKRKSRK